MSETLDECLGRVQLMAQGDPTWDLSENDQHALTKTLMEIILLREAVHTATERAAKAEAELATERGRLDWLEKIGFSTTNSSSEYAPGVHCWRDKDGWGWTAHWISSECKTARAAIDAAIAQAGTESNGLASDTFASGTDWRGNE